MASNVPEGEMESSTPPSLPPKIKQSSVKESKDFLSSSIENVSPKPIPKPRSKPSMKQSPIVSPTKPRPTPRSRTSATSIGSASTTDLSCLDLSASSDLNSEVLSASVELESSVYDNPKSETVKEAIYANEGGQHNPLETDIDSDKVYENTPFKQTNSVYSNVPSAEPSSNVPSAEPSSNLPSAEPSSNLPSAEPSEAIYANEPNDIPNTENSKPQPYTERFSLPMYLNNSESTSGSTLRSSEAISVRSSISRTSGVYNVEEQERIYLNQTSEYFSSTDIPNEKHDTGSSSAYLFDNDVPVPKPCSQPGSDVERSRQSSTDIFPFSPPITYANESPDVTSLKFENTFDLKPERLSDFLKSVKEEHEIQTTTGTTRTTSDEIDALTRKMEKIGSDEQRLSLDLNKQTLSVNRPDQSLSMYINSLGSSFPDADDFENMIDSNLEKKKEARTKETVRNKQSENTSVRREKHPFKRSDAISDNSQDAISPSASIREPIITAETSDRFSVNTEEVIYEAIWVAKTQEKESRDKRESSTDDVIDDSLMSFSPNRDSPLTLEFVPNKTTVSDMDVPKIPEKPKATPEIWGEYAYLDPNAVYVTPPPHFPPPPLPNRSSMPTAEPPPLPNVPAPLTSSQEIFNAPPVPPRLLHEINKGSKSSSPVPCGNSSSPQLTPSRPAPGVPRSVKSRSPVPEPVNIPDNINAKYRPETPDSKLKPTLTESSDEPTSYVGHDPVERQDSDVFKGFQTPKMELFQDDPFKYSDFATVCENFNRPSGSTTEQSLTKELASWDPFGTNSTSESSASYDEKSKFDPFGLDSDNVSDQSASSDWFNRISLSNVPPPPASKRGTPKNLGSEFAEASKTLESTDWTEYSINPSCLSYLTIPTMPRSYQILTCYQLDLLSLKFSFDNTAWRKLKSKLRIVKAHSK
ncbi:hypothetical protein LOTGIDRAFT_165062 [Lottia gigantea]|uniref:Uncharacterized protein n=1 Tax=Lottia gigantea TaxID=225164 RepID=V3ZYK5_LOTGI|nr:hypothetical protein LOTGIDRAFT_165062 [Lottia gigantea]ESO89467.1 hypothetical protein LOTGIDRAFT_165062 [Lottia gigantea]